MTSEFFTVVLLEESEIFFQEVQTDSTGAISPSNARYKYKPKWPIEDPKPAELFDELAHHLDKHWDGESVKSFRGSIANNRTALISLPGTIEGNDTILSSSRLKIYDRFKVAEFLKRHQINSALFHDVEAMAWGELHLASSNNSELEKSGTLALILVDEGVGSKFIIDGKTHIGAGVAGTISRLVVQPEGAFFSKLLSRGNLEVYTSRPWISQTIVENFNSLSEKVSSRDNISEQYKMYERKLAALSKEKNNWLNLSFDDIKEGIDIGHPCCEKAVSLAEKYIGRAIHSIMTILNPHEIVIGGGAIEKIPNFYENVVEVARDLSWPNCWNNTKIRRAMEGRLTQVYGSVVLSRRQYEH